MIDRRALMTVAAAAALAPQARAAGAQDIFHVAVFRFDRQHVAEAIAAFRTLAPATRQQPGNLAYSLYRGTDDDLEFYILEHWASPAALAAHEQSEVFIRFGQGVLAKYATLHDTVTARPFE